MQYVLFATPHKSGLEPKRIFLGATFCNMPGKKALSILGFNPLCFFHSAMAIFLRITLLLNFGQWPSSVRANAGRD